jgi:hypothetical protein
MERREFIGVATRAAVGVAVGGAAVLAGCTDDAPDVASRTSSTGSGGTTATSTTGASTTSSGPVVRDAIVFRLSTRGPKAPCAACRAHAAHRHFATAEAADAGRAHPGCDCTIREQPVTSGQLEQWFAAGHDVHDDRWAT